jgi:hypothetical protein
LHVLVGTKFVQWVVNLIHLQGTMDKNFSRMKNQCITYTHPLNLCMCVIYVYLGRCVFPQLKMRSRLGLNRIMFYVGYVGHE